MEEELKKQTFELVPYFSFDGYKGLVKIVDIYDGDTCTIVFPFRDIYCKYRCRLIGINAPELKPGLEVTDRVDVVKKAIACRNRFASIVLRDCNLHEFEQGETVISSEGEIHQTRTKLQELLGRNSNLNYCHISGFDKYGRLLINLYERESSESKTINQILLEEKLAYFYN